MEQRFKLLPVPEFIEDLIDKVEKSQKQVYIQAMIVELGGKLSPLASSLLKAAKRGVKVTIVIDYFTLLVTDGHILNFPLNDDVKTTYIKKIRRENHDILKDLHEAGAEIYFINKPRNLFIRKFPKLKRNHIKLCLVDDIGYMGGSNMYESALKYADFMVRFTDPSYVNILKDISMHMDKNVYENDSKFKIGNVEENSSFLVDIGKSNSSIIYSEAIKAIKEAKADILFVSQYLPDFELLSLLNKKAKEGIDITIITQPPHLSGDSLENFIDRTIYLMRSRIKAYIYPNAKIHTKIILVDRKTSPTVIFGSHNYSKFGVIFATNELALKTNNRELIDQVSSWCKNLENEKIPLYLFAQKSKTK